jgi:hypothetical protein
MILIGVPEEFVGGVIAVCGIALIAAGVIVDWDHGKPA